MPFRDGSAPTRISDVDPLNWQLFDGEIPITLSDATDIKITFESKIDQGVISKTLLLNPTQVLIVDAATIPNAESGEVLQFKPLAGDFVNVEDFKILFNLVDSAGNHYIPKDREYTLTVKEVF